MNEHQHKNLFGTQCSGRNYRRTGSNKMSAESLVKVLIFATNRKIYRILENFRADENVWETWINRKFSRKLSQNFAENLGSIYGQWVYSSSFSIGVYSSRLCSFSQFSNSTWNYTIVLSSPSISDVKFWIHFFLCFFPFFYRSQLFDVSKHKKLFWHCRVSIVFCICVRVCGKCSVTFPISYFIWPFVECWYFRWVW